MRKLVVFNHVTLDGYFVGANGDSLWAHQGNEDPEFSSFVSDNAKGKADFLFGRKTYEMMASWWPTPAALQAMPVVAKAMNEATKYVFSRTLDKAGWSNSKIVKGDLVSEVKKLKSEQGPDILIFGSGVIISQLAAAKVIDEYQMVINPIVLGQGRTMFEGMKNQLGLKLTKSKAFKNGKVFVCLGC